MPSNTANIIKLKFQVIILSSKKIFTGAKLMGGGYPDDVGQQNKERSILLSIQPASSG